MGDLGSIPGLGRVTAVVEPRFMCLTHSEAQQMEMSEFEAEKCLLIGRAPVEKVEDVDLSQIHLPGCPWFLKVTFGGGGCRGRGFLDWLMVQVTVCYSGDFNR